MCDGDHRIGGQEHIANRPYLLIFDELHQVSGYLCRQLDRNDQRTRRYLENKVGLIDPKLLRQLRPDRAEGLVVDKRHIAVKRKSHNRLGLSFLDHFLVDDQPKSRRRVVHSYQRG